MSRRISQRIYFIRELCAVHADMYYEQRTGVCIAGDVAGYNEFCECLETCAASGKVLHIAHIPQRSNSMLAVVIPSTHGPFDSPRIKVVERVVFCRATPRMQLMFVGNPPGLRRLSCVVRDISNDSADSIFAHVDLDDLVDSWIVPRSVAVNIRAPLRKWSKAGLHELAPTIYSRTDYFFPNDVDYLSASSHLPPDPDDPLLSLWCACESSAHKTLTENRGRRNRDGSS